MKLSEATLLRQYSADDSGCTAGGCGLQALKRWFIFNGVVARVELVPFPFVVNPDFIRNSE
jgi:hypothetical protein